MTPEHTSVVCHGRGDLSIRGGGLAPDRSGAATGECGAVTGECGAVSIVLPLLLWIATVVAIVVVDIGGYLVAASRAQSLADGAALAAVAASAPGYRGPGPQAEAGRVVDAGDGRLESCTCPARSEHAQATVSVAVPGLVVPRVGASRVEADAAAMLAPPEELAPGPTRERARWPRWDPP